MNEGFNGAYPGRTGWPQAGAPHREARALGDSLALAYPPLLPASCRRSLPGPHVAALSLGLVLTFPWLGLTPGFFGAARVSCLPEDLAQGPSPSLGAHTLCFPHGRVCPTVGFFPGPQAPIL